ncbi:MAG: alpha/beta hydrolase, partial [Chlamydiae bacterium]|nr:alpha/beta hydrolase [Chlamydiota bacterium]
MFKKIIKLLCGLLTVALCSLFLYLYTIQESLLFKSEALVENHKFSSPHTFEEVFFATEDGARIHALHYRADHPKGVVVYFHGRSGNLATYWGKFAGQFLSQDYDVIMMDYRGFGKSRGKLSQELFLKDAGLVYDYAAKLYAPHQIVIYGCSLGTGIATYIASQYEAKLLILEAPYISILHLAMVEFPHVPKKLLS